MEKNFDSWFNDLCSNHVWYEPASLKHRPETFKSICEKVYMDYLAGNGVKSIEDCRRHVYNIVVKTPRDNKKVDWVKMALEKKEPKKEEEWKPVSWEKRAEYLKQVQAEIDKIENNKIRPLFKGEAEVKGQYDPPKPSATCAPAAPVEVVDEHINKVNTARRKYYLDRNPNASEEEIQAYLNKFDVL